MEREELLNWLASRGVPNPALQLSRCVEDLEATSPESTTTHHEGD